MGYEASIIDFYDDGGALLRQALPDAHTLPEFVKTAGVVDQGTPGNMFALVMVDDSTVMKKYATADAGNTWLSTLYFSLTRQNLPEEAQKLAAANLTMACTHYGIEPPDELLRLSEGHAPDTNVVDVTGRKPPTIKVAEKVEVDYALERADGTKAYPLSNAASVRAADEYFSQHRGSFHPRERREYAVKVASVAKRTGFPVSDDIAIYAGTEFAPSLDSHLAVRYNHLIDSNASPEVRQEFMKVANQKSEVGPDQFASWLSGFDEANGLDLLWDRGVADPWHSTFGLLKVAKGKGIDTATYTAGVETVTAEQLADLAKDPVTLTEHFGESFTRGFTKEPGTVFESMPLPQKKLIARLASDITGDR
jgi:hypothetical protein